MKIIFSCIFGLLLLCISVFNTQAQQIIQLTYEPEYPGLNDTITVHYGIKYPSLGCMQDSIVVDELFFGQYMISSYTCCLSGSSTFYQYYGELEIFPDLFSQGYVDVYFQVGYLTTSSCPGFPILVSGDTISYPTEIDHIEIPVGFTAGQTEVQENDIFFEVFPNPVESGMNVQFDLKEGGNVQFEIFDFQGKLVKSLQFSTLEVGVNTVELDLRDLSKGMYAIQLIVNETSYHRKFIKQ